MYGYIGWRIIVPAAFSAPVNILLWGMLVVALALPFVVIMARFNGVHAAWVDWAAWVGYLSFGFLTLLFAFVAAKDIVLLAVAGYQKVAHLFSGSGGADSAGVDPGRRQMVTNVVNLGLLGVTGALASYGVYGAMRRPRVIEVDVPLANLPPDLEGFRIVQITDIHVSSTIKRPFVQAVVDTVNGLKPDLVALTGDLVDGSVAQLRDDVAPLADLKAPHGSYFITGNHEYYSGVQPWIDETKRLGFDVLLNEHRLIEVGEGRLLLAGVTDYEGERFDPDHKSDPKLAMKDAPPASVKVLLAHQPKSIYAAEEAGYDYVISGHTHGGQYFPYHFLAALTQPYISGMHQHGKAKIYVSRGTGYWGPQLRIGAPSEITVHRLVRA